MEEFFEFLIKNWYLSVSLLIILILIIRMELSSNIGGIQTLVPAEVVSKVNRESAVILDMRQPDLFKQGHIIDSINFLLDDFDKQVKKLNKYKDKPIIVTCESGQRSLKLAKQLQKTGFQSIFMLKNGMTAWREAGLPTTKS